MSSETQLKDNVADECMSALLQQRVCSHCLAPHQDLMLPLQCGLHRMCLKCVKTTLQTQFYHMHHNEVFENLYRVECAQCNVFKYLTLPLRQQLLDSPAHFRLSSEMLQLVPAGAQRYARGSHKCRLCQVACISDKALREHSSVCVSRTLCPFNECSQLVPMSQCQRPHACSSNSCSRCSSATNMTLQQLHQHESQCELFEMRLQNLHDAAETLRKDVHAQHCTPLQLMNTIAALNCTSKALENAMSCPPSSIE